MPTATLSPSEIDTILNKITTLKAQRSLIDSELKSLQDQLTTALDAGEIDNSFNHNDWSFSYSKGKLSTTYSDEAKDAINRIQSADIDSGRATQKRGAGFWTIKAPKI